MLVTFLSFCACHLRSLTSPQTWQKVKSTMDISTLLMRELWIYNILLCLVSTTLPSPSFSLVTSIWCPWFDRCKSVPVCQRFNASQRSLGSTIEHENTRCTLSSLFATPVSSKWASIFALRNSRWHVKTPQASKTQENECLPKPLLSLCSLWHDSSTWAPFIASWALYIAIRKLSSLQTTSFTRDHCFHTHLQLRCKQDMTRVGKIKWETYQQASCQIWKVLSLALASSQLPSSCMTRPWPPILSKPKIVDVNQLKLRFEKL